MICLLETKTIVKISVCTPNLRTRALRLPKDSSKACSWSTKIPSSPRSKVRIAKSQSKSMNSIAVQERSQACKVTMDIQVPQERRGQPWNPLTGLFGTVLACRLWAICFSMRSETMLSALCLESTLDAMRSIKKSACWKLVVDPRPADF